MRSLALLHCPVSGARVNLVRRVKMKDRFKTSRPPLPAHSPLLLSLPLPPLPTSSSAHGRGPETNALSDFFQLLHSMRDPGYGSARSSLAQDLLDISLHPHHSGKPTSLSSPASLLPCTSPIAPHTCSRVWYFDDQASLAPTIAGKASTRRRVSSAPFEPRQSITGPSSRHQSMS